jgi:hypothetical protein
VYDDVNVKWYEGPVENTHGGVHDSQHGHRHLGLQSTTCNPKCHYLGICGEGITCILGLKS